MAMAFDPNRWTLRTQEAVQTAVGEARAANHPEVTPDHLLAALLGQEEGVVLGVLQKVGVAPLSVRNQVAEALSKLPKAYGGADPQIGRELREALEAADAVRARIDWKYALGLELTDPGFDFSVLSEFRARLIAGSAEQILLDALLTASSPSPSPS